MQQIKEIEEFSVLIQVSDLLFGPYDRYFL